MLKNGMRPVHAGEVLKEEFLVPMGLSSTALAQKIGVTPARVNDIVLQRRGVSADTALRLSKLFGTSATFWLNLQSNYELRVAEIKLGDKLDKIVAYA